jgi:nucleotide-binding universal stress UspA family protein
MFTHLLVPIDLSARHGQALRIALELARHHGARVTLLHVIQRLADTEPGELRDFYRRLAGTSQRRLERAARRFVRAGLAVRTEVRIGEPAVDIVRMARSRKADLIVMTSHAVEPRRPGGGWGTVSYKVGALCRCPILLVK